MKDQTLANATSHRKRTREEKNDLCKNWEISGLSRSEFCRRKGLKIETFCNWLYQFQNKKKHPKKLKFVPVERLDSKSEIKLEMCLSNGLIFRFSKLPAVPMVKTMG